ncbi:zinc carboxypeptidase-like [Uranotaenia lowii]|uniref:zinc carboxypeptidase-like n=1 Tax=Uranotaenia lowii TaxID=190385 RepID=UPI002479D1F0|nr:zinc carboxypeptidase-like [Uranotaenia lowii]
MFCKLLFLALVASSIAEKARYDNYRLYRIQIENTEQLEVLRGIEEIGEGYDFWTEPANVGSHADLVVPPHKFGEFSDFVERFNLQASLSQSNLQTIFDEEQRRPARSGMSWTAYHRLDVIFAWMDQLLATYPNVLTPISAGLSFEGRPLRGLKVSYKAGNPGVMIESLIHAREWVSGATATWILNELLTSNDPQVRNIAENYDWHFFPVANPDGYEFTHTNTRMWRKTRQPHSILCIGADPNRNFGFNWNQGGSSSVACSDTFHGPQPFSESETRGLMEYFAQHAETISTYISFHSFSQMLLLPYGHTTQHLDNHDQILAIGQKAIDKLRERYGTQYVVGNIAETIYIASGGSIDHVKGVYGTPIAYTYEFRDTGTHGFALPADQIIPNSEEAMDSIIVILEEGEKEGLHRAAAAAAAARAV